MLPRTRPAPEVEVGDEAGLGLVEVLVAMLVFAIVAVSVAYSLTFTLSNTRDAKARQIALNLASQEIDEVRAVGNPFKVHSETTVVTQDGETYTIQRSVAWVTSTGSDLSCNVSGGSYRYKQVNVTVGWANKGPTGIPARSDTLLAPATRINAPSTGTILVSVKGADGLPEAGVTPSVSPSPGTGVTIEPTDVEGCSYILGAAPGSYTVSISRSGYLDVAQQASPSVVGVVAVGASTAFQFQYDQAASFPVRYASNALRLPTQTPAVPAVKIEYPAELTTTYTNSSGTWPFATTVTEASSATAPAGALGTGTAATALHPYATGYQAFAGTSTATCTVHDPSSWAPDTRVTPALIGSRSVFQSTTPGGTAATLAVPMGLVDVVRPTSTRTYLVAIRQPDQIIPGQPACTGSLTYSFGNILTTTATRVALPFGSWKLYAVTSTGTTYNATTVLTTGVTRRTPGTDPVASGTTQGLLALDPRGVAP
ncbi:type IV pilus modification PilV family protein [Agromyces allii]|uniref:Prepilin-type N-terminal cleavage/methylation domain-containing protein n=1 Tax=Agromyces allii TaxID=393607 RepID=A0ABN2Q1N5_9MICO|nr:hypothetical protein [Agromyces allii]